MRMTNPSLSVVAVVVAAATFLLLGLVSTKVQAFSFDSPQSTTEGGQLSSRRQWLSQVAATTTAAVTASTLLTNPQPSFAASSDDLLISELQSSLSNIKEIPNLIQTQEWDKIRTILKTPPVNYLWNLGDSYNTVLKLAKSTGNVELFEMKDDLAYDLQMTDQLVYDNVFIYFQPGNGKLKIKEPTDAINKAIKELDGIIQEAKSSS